MKYGDRDWDEVDLDESLDLDDTGIEDMLDGDYYKHVADKDPSFDEVIGLAVDEALEQIDEDEMVEAILGEPDRYSDYENYSPPYRDDEDAYADGEPAEEDVSSTPPGDSPPDKGYEDYK